MIEFRVVKESNQRAFEEKVTELLNAGFSPDKFESSERGSWTYFIAYMIKGV